MKKMTFTKGRIQRIFELYDRFSEGGYTPTVFVGFSCKYIQVVPMEEEELLKRRDEFEHENMNSWIVYPTRVTKALEKERRTLHGFNAHFFMAEDEIENLRGHSEVSFELLEDKVRWEIK